MVTKVRIVMVIDTQGSWHINLASLFPGISKTLIACMEGILCRVKAATSVSTFYAYKPSILVGLTKLLLHMLW